MFEVRSINSTAEPDLLRSLATMLWRALLTGFIVVPAIFAAGVAPISLRPIFSDHRPLTHRLRRQPLLRRQIGQAVDCELDRRFGDGAFEGSIRSARGR